MASLPRPPGFWRDVNLRSSGCVFSGCRLFGIAFSHGAHRLYLLEWRARSRRQDLGRAARHADVGDPHRRNCLRDLSNCGESFWSKLEWIARLAGLVATLSLRGRADHRGRLRRDPLFRLLPTAVGSLGYVHADPNGRLGYYAGLSRRSPAVQLPLVASGVE